MPEFNVTNHHLLTGENFHRLLRQAKVFIGFGFPIEGLFSKVSHISILGPAPLEAGMFTVVLENYV